MRRSGIRELMDLAATIPDVLHLEVGEPDFATPAHIIEAAVAAARAGFTHYTPNAGLPELRATIADVIAPTHGRAVAPEQVVVTSGSVCGLMTSLMALVEPGEEVMIPDPGWPNYEMMVRSIGAEPVRYRLDPADEYVPDLDALARQVGPRTKVILVNSPSNPTGAVFSAATARSLVEFAAAHDLYVLSDEVYEKLVFEATHHSLGQWDADGRVVCVYSFSKTYAMTGWRVGYVVAPPAIANVVTKLQEPVVSCASAVSQKAAEAALTGPQTCVDEMREAYRARRDAALSILAQAGVVSSVPRGAFYILVDASRVALDTYAFAYRVLREQRVAVAPGETFGPAGRGLVRVSLATDQSVLEEGVRRLVETIVGVPALAG
ncbi:MAG: pyridoxal phosphate-dependent aminotransferase [Chloroflexota bacterium]